MKLKSVTTQPGTHSPQVIDLSTYESIEYIGDGVIKIAEQPVKGKPQQFELIKSWLSARGETEPVKGR